MGDIEVENLKNSGRIIYQYTAGSHLYGLNVPTSDFDTRGIYFVPKDEYITLGNVNPQVGDEKSDVLFYTLGRFLELLKKANPNVMEALWVPEDCVQVCNRKIMSHLFQNRKMFVTKESYFSHANYATAQIGRAKGCNKRVNNPQPKERPKREDFCYVIQKNIFGGYSGEYTESFPARPVPLKDTKIDLSKCHVAALERVPNTFRLYDYSDSECKGVFRGNDSLVCESIPIEDEIKRFIGLLVYNHSEYEKAIKEHAQYHEWIAKRNPTRWIDQEKGLLQFDGKNMMHCIRLMMSSEHVLLHGEPLVRVTGEQRDHLMRIRKGDFTYEEIMQDVEVRKARLEKLFSESKLPEDVDHAKVERLYKELMEIGG